MTDNAPKFTQDDKDHLYKYFEADKHEVRVLRTVGKEVPHALKKNNGKPVMVGEWAIWSVYIKRDAIIDRMNERFFGEWSSGFLDPSSPVTYHQSHVDCAMHMTIRDVRMEYNGSQSGTGENGGKGAATDAFKRVASQWGIGLYLQHAPLIMTKNPDQFSDRKQQDAMESEAMQKVVQWINELTGGQSPQPAPRQQLQQTQSEDDNTPNPKWLSELRKLTSALYADRDGKVNVFHQNASIQKALDEGTITTEKSASVAAAMLFVYRAETDLEYTTNDIQEVLECSVSDWLKAGKTIAEAWDKLCNEFNEYDATGTDDSIPF